MDIRTTRDLGALLKQLRKEKGFTQEAAAAFCGVGIRFLSDLENGKPTVQMGKALEVASAFGLNLEAKPRGGRKVAP